MINKKIVVLMGGPSKEADVSRRTGAAIVKALQSRGYDAVPLELVPAQVVDDIKKLNGQIVFNAVHGLYGEDGALQGLLEMAGIPYTGSGLMTNAIGMNKKVSKDIFMGAKIPTARSSHYDSMHMSKADIGEAIHNDFAFPCVLKAPTQGSSIGVVIVHDWSELDEAIVEVLKFGHIVMVEDYLDGKEFTVSVLNGKALPVIQINPHSGVYDYQSKYTKGSTDYLVPAPISEELKAELQAVAEKVYVTLQCAGLVRVDFMSNKNDEIFVLEINTVPGMTETSLAPKAAASMGMDFPALCEAILATAGMNKL